MLLEDCYFDSNNSFESILRGERERRKRLDEV